MNATSTCPFGTDIDVYGVHLGIRTNELATLEHLPRHLPVGWKRLNTSDVERIYSLQVKQEAGGNGPCYVLREGTRTLEATDDLDYALQTLEYDVELYVAENTPDYVFVHAGVVGWQGRAIVIPGASYSGKSSLVAALCQAGASYYSDEFALLDDQGRVHAYPRPLHLRQPVPNVGDLNRDRLELELVRQPLPIALVVLTQFQHGAHWQPSVVSAGNAMLELLSCTLSARRQSQRALTVLWQALQSAWRIRSPRHEAWEIAGQLLDLTIGQDK